MKKGFTIIEVVLVLAIAGLIFLMIFIALPALQRAQRDNARKQDVSIVAAAIQSWRSNNRGMSLQQEDDLYIAVPGNDPQDTTNWQTTGNSKQLGPYLDATGNDPDHPNQVLSSNSTLVGIYYGVGKTMTYQVGEVDKAGHISIFTGCKCPPAGYDTVADRVVLPKGTPNNYAVIIVLETGGFYCQDI